MTSLAFERCNAVGRAAEERVAQILFKAGWQIEWRPARHRRDLVVRGPGGFDTIEVKCEDAFEASADICVELYQGKLNRRASGLRVTEATVCVHTLGDKCVVYRAAEMRNHIDAGLARFKYFLKDFGKSDNANGGVLVPQMIVATNEWGDYLEVEQLHTSRVFRAVE